MNSVIISININENIEYKYHTTAGQLLLSFKISFRIMQDGSKVIRGTLIEKSNPSEYPQSIVPICAFLHKKVSRAFKKRFSYKSQQIIVLKF